MSPSELRESVGNALYRQVGRASGRVQNHRSLPADVLETDTAYRVVFDAPGVEPDDVQVRYLEGNVKIRIERFRKFHEGYEMRFPGRGMKLNGEAELPADAVVDPDASTAKLTERGTLSVELPKDAAVENDGSGTDDEREDADEPGRDAESVTVDD